MTWLVLAVAAPAAIVEGACGARSALEDPAAPPPAPDAATEVDSAVVEDAGVEIDAGADADAEVDATIDAPEDVPPPVTACAWTRAFPGPTDTPIRGLAVDPAGAVVVAGQFQGTVDFGLGPVAASSPSGNPYVLKLGADGKTIWFRQFGNAGTLVVTGLATDGSGNIVITGIMDAPTNFGGGPIGGGTSFAVAKLAPDGSHLWSRALKTDAGLWQILNPGVAVDSAGNIALVGGFTGALDINGIKLGSPGGPLAGFAARLTPAGDPLWAKAFFGAISLEAGIPPIAVDSAGNIGLTGSVFGTVNFGGGPIGVPDASALFVTKLSAGGAHVFSEAFPTKEGASLAVNFSSQGDLILTGLSSSGIDFGGGPLPLPTPPGGEAAFAVDLTGSGAHVYSRLFAGPYGRGTHIVASPGGGSWITGVAKGPFDVGTGPIGAVDNNIFFARLSPAGETLAARAFPHGEFTNHHRLGVHPSGDVIMAGEFIGSTDFGDGPIVGTPNHETAYVARCVP